jgi:DNA invertase Pin-like site-specific DNA recombinase
MVSTPRRAAIYARVSTGEQTPENQLRVLREVADRAGWAVAAEYVETASGATAKRAGLERMLADATRRKFDTLLCWDVSRLGRSLRDLVDIFETLRALKIDLVIQQQGIDTQTPAGIAMMQMSGVFAQFERSMIVERTKAGMARARARGAQIGRAPAGDGVVAAIRSLRAQGVSMDRIARDLKIGKGVSQRVCQQFDREQGAAR